MRLLQWATCQYHRKSYDARQWQENLRAAYNKEAALLSVPTKTCLPAIVTGFSRARECPGDSALTVRLWHLCCMQNAREALSHAVRHGSDILACRRLNELYRLVVGAATQQVVEALTTQHFASLACWAARGGGVLWSRECEKAAARLPLLLCRPALRNCSSRNLRTGPRPEPIQRLPAG